MRDDGIRNSLAFVTSAYSSYSSCRQYLENISEALSIVGPEAPKVEKLRAFFNHPDFIAANVDNIRLELDQFPKHDSEGVHLVFTAHSIPESMAQNSDYQSQLHETGRLIASELLVHNWQIVFQSRSGSPRQTWLGPDVCDALIALRAQGVSKVILAPIGFVSDHMEVIYDLDIQARELCDRIGVNMRRAATAGTHPAFVKMIRELIMERIEPTTARRFLGSFGPRSDVCLPGCCALL
jgi:ferrochelatase